MRNRHARQYQKLIQSENEKVSDNQRTAVTTISVTGDIAITQHDQLLCRLHDQLGWRATVNHDSGNVVAATFADVTTTTYVDVGEEFT